MTGSITRTGTVAAPTGPAVAHHAVDPATWRAELAELLAGLASDLIYQPAGDARSALISALGAVNRFLGADRGCLYRKMMDHRYLALTHETYGLGVGPLSTEGRTLRLDGAPAVAALLRGGESVELDLMYEPADGVGRRLLGSDRVRAAVLLPLRVEDRLIGLVRFDSLRTPPWPARTGYLLRPFGALCARAIAAQNAIAGLEASELRHRSVLDEIADVVVRIGPQGNLTYINRAWHELTGNPVADMVGVDPLANVHPDDRALAVEHMTAAIAGRPGVREVRFLTHDGGVRWMEVRGRALFDGDGNGVGFSGVLHDVTERKEAEIQVRAARDEAERVRDEAERARDEAERAREDAERARDEAERARQEAERARDEAEHRMAVARHT